MGVFALAGHSTGLALVEIALALSGMGLGVASPSLSATVSNEFAPEDLGTAAASQQLMNQLGTVAGHPGHGDRVRRGAPGTSRAPALDCTPSTSPIWWAARWRSWAWPVP